MNPQLESLILAYDAATAAQGEESEHLLAIYESRLDDVLARQHGLAREKLEAAVRVAHLRWLKAQKKITTLPPKA